MTRSYLGYVSSQTTDVATQAETTPAVCSGGTESDITIGTTTYRLHTFTGDGTLTVTTPGFVDVLMFGGGGSGGALPATTRAAGGGGAGGVLESTVYLAANTTITIGAGGAGSSTVYTSGSGSSLGNTNRSLNVAGGGIGGGQGQEQTIPTTGGCGGGGLSQTNTALRTGAVSMNPSVSGFAGGDGTNTASGSGAGGGGQAVYNQNPAVGGSGGQAGIVIVKYLKSVAGE